MKQIRYIVPLLVLIIAISSFSDTGKNPIRETAIVDSIKKQDSLAIVIAKKQDSLAKIKITPYKKNVEASHYADKFNGRRTASGARFHNNNYTAAHKKLKFGTTVKVTNTANGKSVIVTITDRGPFTKQREIDMAKKPFLEISHNNGRAPLRVNLEIIE
jgi:rare lipoprotein A